MSRYQVRLVPGSPVTDLRVGVTLRRVGEGGGAGSGTGSGSGSGGGTAAPEIYWQNYPFRGEGDDVLALIKLSTLNPVGCATVPDQCAVEHVLWGWEAWRGIVSAYIENVPEDAVIEWSISEPTITPSYTWNDVAYTSPGGPLLVKVDNSESLHAVASGRVAQFRLVAPSNWTVPVWQLSPIYVSATVNGVPTRTLTLNVRGEAWDYSPGPIE